MAEVSGVGASVKVQERPVEAPKTENKAETNVQTDIFRPSATAYQEKTGFNQGAVYKLNLQTAQTNSAAKTEIPKMDDKSEKELAKLDPALADRVRLMASDLKSQGITVVVAPKGGMRTFAEQDALYAQGRTAPGNVVTNARGGESFHNYGLAVDIVPVDKNGSATWGAGKDVTNKIGAAGEKQGLEWGGNWSDFPDTPHFQIKGDVKYAKDLLPTYNQGGLSAVWDKVNKNYPPVGGVNAPSTTPGNGLQVDGAPNYGQKDAPWGNERYNVNPTQDKNGRYYTFGELGCTATCTAIAASWATGTKIDPSAANNNFGGTLSKFEMTNLFPDGKARAFDYSYAATGSQLTKGSPQANALLDRVKDSIKTGHPVALGIYGNVQTPDGETWLRHTVVATGINDKGEIMVNDPATGKQQPLSAFKYNSFDLAQQINKKGGAGGTVSGSTPTNPTTPTNPSNPSLPVPTAQLEKGSTGEQVKQLQNALVKLGFMSQADVNTGYGTFGSKTEQAVKNFQNAHGIEPIGVYGPKTQAALRAALGKASGTTTAPPTSPPPTSNVNGLPKTVEQANQFFKNQFTSKFNPNGPPTSSDCGPASLEMALEAAGLRPASHDQTSINQARSAMGAGTSGDTTLGQVAAGARYYGANVSTDSGWAAFDKALDSGKTVILAGDMNPTYVNGAFGGQANYGKYTSPGHIISVVGKTADGKYLVADPMSRNGVVAMTQAQLKPFVSGSNNSNQGSPQNFVAISNPKAATGAPTTTPTQPPTSTAPTNSSLPVPTASLQKGSTGEQVKQLQDALVKLNYMTRAEVNTGYGTFGPKTEAAVKNFQRDHGIEQIGIYGPKTQAALRTALSNASGTTAPTAPATGTSAREIANINSILRGTGLAGKGEVIANLAKKYNVPPELALAMFRKEASFATPGSLAAQNNNPGNLRFVGQAGATRGAGGFAKWDSMDQGIEAYFKLLNNSYRSFIDNKDWAGLVNKYAPPSENDSALYTREITGWISDYQQRINK